MRKNNNYLIYDDTILIPDRVKIIIGNKSFWGYIECNKYIERGGKLCIKI